MLNRRAFLHAAGAFGLFSSQPMLTLAAAPTDKRLVVIMLRGAMDGLDVVQPAGDPGFAALRPATAAIAPAPAAALDDFFQLHEALAPIRPLYAAHELAFVHAVSTPYRSRSHFDGQDMLEEGAAALHNTDGGWINRLISLTGNRRINYAADIGTADSLLFRGPAEYLNVYPETGLDFWQDSAQFLRLLYQDDPAFKDSFQRIEQASSAGMEVQDIDRGVSTREVAALAANLLKGEARIAAFSVYGWDTHFRQANKLTKSLGELSGAIFALKKGLGADWQKTAVVAVTEFGRTARFNGTLGTDHGTGGLAILAGGLLANAEGGKVLATRWPGVAADQLYEGRDLMPTDDVRRYLGWIVASLFDLAPGTVAREVFPGVELGARLKLV